MTEEIIIDGVDVSECSHFKYENVDCVIYNTCCWGFDCNYKQRKRKEKECEELKERLNTTCFDPKNNNCRCISYNRIAADYKADLIELRKVKKKNMELEAHLLFIQNIYNSLYREKKDILLNPNQKEMQFIYGESKGCTAIYAIDKPSPNNNSYHEFIINYEPDSVTIEFLGKIKLQNGNFAEFGHNGIFTEHLLVIAKDCLERFNTSKYACRENSIAINNINTALRWLNKRATERVKRGVYGTETI